ncbi:MAG TPA: hypothetical protein VJ323_04550 [Bryobacteraceae bacterium]|nr:hypothetical protein [Bryobacteraceae bacterium]
MLGVAIFERTVSRILRRLRLNHYMIVTAMSLAGAWIPRCEVFPVDVASTSGLPLPTRSGLEYSAGSTGSISK